MVEKVIVLVFSLIAITFSVSAFFVANDQLLFGLLDLVSLLLLAFAFMFYRDQKHGHKHSFVESFNKIGHMKSIGGVFGAIYLIAIASDFFGYGENNILFAVLLMFTILQVMVAFVILSFSIWD